MRTARVLVSTGAAALVTEMPRYASHRDEMPSVQYEDSTLDTLAEPEHSSFTSGITASSNSVILARHCVERHVSAFLEREMQLVGNDTFSWVSLTQLTSLVKQTEGTVGVNVGASDGTGVGASVATLVGTGVG